MGRGRGGKGGKAGRGGKGGGGGSAATSDNRVCKPAISKLPTSLLPLPLPEGVPKPIIEALTEFRGAQPFFSALERIHPEVATHNGMSACWLGRPGDSLKALHRDDAETNNEHGSFGATLEMTDGTRAPVFVKRIHLLDPILAIQGETVGPLDGALPAPAELWLTALEKLNDPMNEAYVDAVFATLADRMVSEKISPHWVRCYGTFPARVERYFYNISDEYSSMKRKSFWTRHQRMGIFSVHREATEDANNQSDRVRTTEGLQFSEEMELEDVGIIDEANVVEVQSRAIPAICELEEAEIEDEAEPIVLAPSVRIRRIPQSYSSDSSDSSDSSSSSATDEEDDSMDTFAEFKDFPVQVTLLEKAEGTMDELLDEETHDNTKDARWSAWLFQVIAGLAAAQHWFGFVHNDLHTNNVMWVKTAQTHIVYRVNKTKGKEKGKVVFYRVPTYGYIMKIIDFGRATFWLPEPAGFFISDAFYPGNDAGHQYNCEPFFDSKNGKRVEPNPSFDLCRLAISLLESLYPMSPAVAKPIKIMSREGSKSYPETESAVYNLIWEWLTDDAGKNMLREPNGKERYPDFDLYAAIATDVHRAVPSAQIEKSVFLPFRSEVAPTESEGDVFDLWV